MTRILIVEDDADILNMIWDALRDAGYIVLGAANGEEGLDQVRYHAPHLVIVDLMMPISSGIAMAAALRAEPRYRDLPVVGISGALRPIAAAEGLFTAFIAKPFDVDDMLDAVASVLAKTG